MNAPMRKPEPIGFDDYLAFADRRPEHEVWDLVAGSLVMMTRATPRHSLIVTNLVLALGPAMRTRGCAVLADVLVRDRDQDDYAVAPDVQVRCGPTGTERWTEDPVVAVEVLSPSTMDVDRGPKLAFYKRVPSLRHIAFVYQDAMRIEAYARAGETWDLSIGRRPADALSFAAVAFTAPLAAIYDGVTFD